MSGARDLEADLKLCEAATPGPWGWTEVGLESLRNGPSQYGKEEMVLWPVKLGNRAFIATARTALPYYITEVKRLRERVNELEVQDPDFVQSAEPTIAIREVREWANKEIAHLTAILKEGFYHSDLDVRDSVRGKRAECDDLLAYLDLREKEGEQR